MPRTLLLAVLAVLAAVRPAAAWNDRGHMMIAAVAWDLLTDAARTRVAGLLALSQYPVDGVNDTATDLSAKAQFMQASTAVDAIKRFRTDYTDDGDAAADAPAPAANRGFDDRYMHKYWHFVDLPFSPDGTPLVPPPPVNVQERITLFRKLLGTDAPDALKAYDLVWLLHLVGDIHQPLHATSRFTQDLPRGDAGGNLVRLTQSPAPKLHAYWDQLPGTSRSVAGALEAAQALPTPDPAQVALMDAAIWAQESLALAQSVAYAPPIGPGAGPYQLDAAYEARAEAAAQQRLALAGARLARLINTELR